MIYDVSLYFLCKTHVLKICKGVIFNVGSKTDYFKGIVHNSRLKH